MESEIYFEAPTLTSFVVVRGHLNAHIGRWQTIHHAIFNAACVLLVLMLPHDQPRPCVLIA